MPGTAATGRATRAAAVLLVVAALAIVAAPGRFTPGAPGPGVGRGGDAATSGAGPGAGMDDVPPPPAPVASPAGAVTAPAEAPTGDLGLVEVRGGWRGPEDLGTAVALAVLTGGAHVRSLAVDARPPLVAVEAVEQPGPDAAVVTLLVAPDPAGPDADRAVRLAVPILLGPGRVRVGGPPWRLPGPDLTPAPPTGRPITDPALLDAARAALSGAGLDATAMRGVEATDAWPFVALLTAPDAPHAPDAPDARGPWLRWHLDRFVVTGLPLQTAAGTGPGTEIP